MTDELPEGWASVCVGDVIVDLKYGTSKKCDKKARGVPVLRIPNIVDGTIDHRDLKYAELSLTEQKSLGLVPGDVLVIRSNGSVSLVGRSAVVRESERDFAFAGYLIRLRSSEAILPEFLNRALGSYDTRLRIELEARSTSGVNNINAEEIRALPFALPPIAEQKRILAALARPLARSEICQTRLDRIPALLRRFRRAVLMAACRGWLTADWRTEKNTLGTHGCPPGWGEDTVAGVCEAVVDCPHSTPMWVATGYICVKTTQLSPGKLDLSSPHFVSRDTFEERTKRLKPRAGDILYCREGVVGAACVVPPGVELCLGQRLMLLRSSKVITPEFLMYVLNSELTLAQARDRSLGTTAQHVNVGDVKRFTLLLPPLAEQHEIVRRVELMFALADRLEVRYEKAKAQTGKLTLSILARAFRGELVPTEAVLARREGRSYETAEQLLERIKGQTASAKHVRTKRETTRTAKPHRGRDT